MTNFKQEQKAEQSAEEMAAVTFLVAAGVAVASGAVVPVSAGIAYLTEPGIGPGGALLAGFGASIGMGTGAVLGHLTAKYIHKAFNKIASRAEPVTPGRKSGAAFVAVAGIIAGGTYGASVGYTDARDFVTGKVVSSAESAPVAAYNGPLSFDARTNTLSL